MSKSGPLSQKPLMPCPFCGAEAEYREEPISGSMLVGCTRFSCSSILLDHREWNDSVAWTLCRQMAEAVQHVVDKSREGMECTCGSDYDGVCEYYLDDPKHIQALEALLKSYKSHFPDLKQTEEQE